MHQNQYKPRTMLYMNPKVIGAVVGVIIIAGGAFYGGMMYEKSQTPARGGGTAGQFQRGAGAGGAGARGGGGFTSGDILSKDATSLTIKMMDGSTKIVLFSGSTMITKSAPGTPADLSQGTRVSVVGTANQDGSVTAQNILIGSGLGFGRTGGSPNQMAR